MTTAVTKESLAARIADLEYGPRSLKEDYSLAAYKMLLATMDSEPVAEVVSMFGDPEAFGEREIKLLVGIQNMPYGTKLYRHAQPAPVVSGWIPVGERVPEEGGRYWCYVEEQNSLGKSHYQWNCSWNGDVWSDKALTGRVTHWMPLPAGPVK